MYLLLDDIAGITLVMGWARIQWAGAGSPDRQSADHRASIANMAGICIGFRPGSSALSPSLFDVDDDAAIVPPLVREDDPDGWHRFPALEGPDMRRARRIDLWREDGLIQIDATFQDSAAMPDGRRRGLHEYSLRATVEEAGMCVTSLDARPHILPYRECPAAVVNLDAILGAKLPEMREFVLSRLRRTAGCTHLNDMLRALADVPQLVAQLPDDRSGGTVKRNGPG